MLIILPSKSSVSHRFCEDFVAAGGRHILICIFMTSSLRSDEICLLQICFYSYEMSHTAIQLMPNKAVHIIFSVSYIRQVEMVNMIH